MNYRFITGLSVCLILFMWGCGGSTGSKAMGKQKVDSQKIKLTGSLPGKVGIGQKLHSVLNVDGGFLQSANLASGPGWLHLDVSDNGQKLVLFGNAPSEEAISRVSINLQYNSGRTMGFSFSLAVMKKKATAPSSHKPVAGHLSIQHKN